MSDGGFCGQWAAAQRKIKAEDARVVVRQAQQDQQLVEPVEQPAIHGWTPPLIRGQQVDRVATQADIDCLVQRSEMLDGLLHAFQAVEKVVTRIRAEAGGDGLELKL